MVRYGTYGGRYNHSVSQCRRPHQPSQALVALALPPAPRSAFSPITVLPFPPPPLFSRLPEFLPLRKRATSTCGYSVPSHRREEHPVCSGPYLAVPPSVPSAIHKGRYP